MCEDSLSIFHEAGHIFMAEIYGYPYETPVIDNKMGSVNIFYKDENELAKIIIHSAHLTSDEFYDKLKKYVDDSNLTEDALEHRFNKIYSTILAGKMSEMLFLNKFEDKNYKIDDIIDLKYFDGIVIRRFFAEIGYTEQKQLKLLKILKNKLLEDKNRLIAISISLKNLIEKKLSSPN